jgi:hypothetical protein
MTSGTYNEIEKRIIENNLQQCNRKIAQVLGRSESSVRNWLYKNHITRTQEQLEQIRSRIAANNSGDNNGNWKGGRSKNNYYYKKRMMEKYPEKMRARQKVYRAKKAGVLVPQPCEICGSEENIESHHPDYKKPLDVMWLCPDHHRRIESENGLFSNKISGTR